MIIPVVSITIEPVFAIRLAVVVVVPGVGANPMSLYYLLLKPSVVGASVVVVVVVVGASVVVM